jgi:hypothetical protein
MSSFRSTAVLLAVSLLLISCGGDNISTESASITMDIS